MPPEAAIPQRKLPSTDKVIINIHMLNRTKLVVLLINQKDYEHLLCRLEEILEWILLTGLDHRCSAVR